MSRSVALITGVTGQDGSYLADLLLQRGYLVHGLIREGCVNVARIEHLRRDNRAFGRSFRLHSADLRDQSSIRRLVAEIRPTEIYHLAGRSHVGRSFAIPQVTCDELVNAVLSLLETLRERSDGIRFYHAASSEIFGEPDNPLQTELTPLRPTSPYGCAKAFATQVCQVYRRAYGLFVCNGIAYNHESPRRGEEFVTRKITLGAARIRLGYQSDLYLGHLNVQRDWGYAPEYVEAMWRMLQQEGPDDYVLATGESHSLSDFLDAAFSHVGLDWHNHVRFDSSLVRPTGVGRLVGDSTKAHRVLGWTAKTKLRAIAAAMVEADLRDQRDRPSAAVAALDFGSSAAKSALGGVMADEPPTYAHEEVRPLP